MGNLSGTMIEVTAAISLFVGALTINGMLVANVSQAVEITNQATVSQDRDLHTTLIVPETYVVSGAVVLQSIYHIGDGGVDIEVDSHVFSSQLDVDKTDVSAINVFGMYAPIYERDAYGQLEKVVYISK